VKSRVWVLGVLLLLLAGGGYYAWQLPSVQEALLARADVASLRSRTETTPTDWRAQYWYGRRLAENGDLPQAEVALRSSLGTHPDYLPALVELGKVLLVANRVEEAFQFLSMVAGRDPKNVEARLALTVLYRSQGAYARAMASAQEVLALEPKNGRALYELGTAQSYAQQFSEAESTFRKAVEQSPRDLPALVGLSRVLRELGRLDEAEATARKALGLAPGDESAMVGLAHVLMRKQGARNREEALELVQKARQIDPRSVELTLMAAELLTTAGRWKDAVPELLAVIRVSPENTRAYYLLSRAYQRLGRPADAARAEATFRRREAIDRTILNLRNEVASDPERASLRYQLAEAYVTGGRLDLAVGSYRSGLERDPRNRKARERLAELMKRAVQQ
jgi:tetratricopeptide (TPR) repeat protein